MKLIDRGRAAFGCVRFRGHKQYRFYRKIIRRSDFVTPRTEREYCPYCGCGSKKRDSGGNWGTFGYTIYRRVRVEFLRCMRCKTGFIARRDA